MWWSTIRVFPQMALRYIARAERVTSKAWPINEDLPLNAAPSISSTAPQASSRPALFFGPDAGPNGHVLLDGRTCLRVSGELNSCATMNGIGFLPAGGTHLLFTVYWFGAAVTVLVTRSRRSLALMHARQQVQGQGQRKSWWVLANGGALN